MDLKSLYYLIFVFAVAVVYYGVYKIPKAQKIVIAIANILFIVSVCYEKALAIILAMTLAVYGISLLIQMALNNKNKGQAKLFMWMGVIFVIAILCYFKFFTYTYDILAEFAAGYGVNLTPLITPVGISYYSLSMIAYILDVYHKKHPAEKNFVDFFVFITYFPAIIQGPIGIYKTIGAQFKQTHEFDENAVIMGLMRIVWGYIKKVVIADRIGIMVIAILKDDNAVGVMLIWAMVLYSFQIYTDFSGGIDVVMGISECLGIKLRENFKAPLISQSVTEYWQRWHMSLGDFMEKYIYYPIVLHRSVMKFSKKIPNAYLQKVFSATFASVIVFVIVGIWHGTGWNYVVYGAYQAFFVSSAVLLGPAYKKIREVLHIDTETMTYKLLTILRTFTILVFGRFFIRAKDLTQAIELFKRAFSKWNINVLFDGSQLNYGLDYKNLYLMYVLIILIIIVDVLHDKGFKFRETILRQDIAFRFTVYFVALFTIIIFGIYGPGYDSVSFIYQGF